MEDHKFEKKDDTYHPMPELRKLWILARRRIRVRHHECISDFTLPTPLIGELHRCENDIRFIESMSTGKFSANDESFWVGGVENGEEE
jgi:hypothetical protein